MLNASEQVFARCWRFSSRSGIDPLMPKKFFSIGGSPWLRSAQSAWSEVRNTCLGEGTRIFILAGTSLSKVKIGSSLRKTIPFDLSNMNSSSGLQKGRVKKRIIFIFVSVLLSCCLNWFLYGWCQRYRSVSCGVTWGFSCESGRWLFWLMAMCNQGMKFECAVCFFRAMFDVNSFLFPKHIFWIFVLFLAFNPDAFCCHLSSWSGVAAFKSQDLW